MFTESFIRLKQLFLFLFEYNILITSVDTTQQNYYSLMVKYTSTQLHTSGGHAASPLAYQVSGDFTILKRQQSNDFSNQYNPGVNITLT